LEFIIGFFGFIFGLFWVTIYHLPSFAHDHDDECLSNPTSLDISIKEARISRAVAFFGIFIKRENADPHWGYPLVSSSLAMDNFQWENHRAEWGILQKTM
jgi:hypothetical protein